MTLVEIIARLITADGRATHQLPAASGLSTTRPPVTTIPIVSSPGVT